MKTMNSMSFDGSMDVIVVREKSGRLSSTPFYVRFGRLSGTVVPADRTVNVEVNGRIVTEITLRLEDDGIAYFNNSAPPPRPSPPSPVLLTTVVHRRPLANSNSLPNLLQNVKTTTSHDKKELRESRSETELNKDHSTVTDLCKDKNNLNSPKVVFLKESDQVMVVENKPVNPVTVEDVAVKSMRINLTSAELDKLELQPGANEIRYFIKNSTKKCLNGFIYLW
jgi:phosphatidate phosphatase PAH1